MKLCRICPDFPEKEGGGGVELHIYYLTKEQKKFDIDINIVTTGEPVGTKNFDGVKVHRVKRKKFFQFTSGFDILKTADRLATTEKFDVLQIHNPLVLPIFPKNLSSIPFVFSIHSSLMDFKNLFSIKSLHQSVRSFLEFYLVSKKFCEKAAKITTGSSDEKYELVKYLGIDEDKIVPVLGKANPKYFKPGVKSNLKEKLKLEGPVVLSIGRFIRKKGYTYLIRAFRKVVNEIPNANLVLVGYKQDDEEYSTITKMIKIFKLEKNIKLLPLAPKKELIYYYSMCDLYVQPSISEGFPQTVQDVMCCAKPVIVSAAYGPKDVIKDNYNGFVVQKRDSETLAERIIELLQDEDKMKLFGKRNRTMAVKELDWKITARKHYEIYKEIVR